MTIINSREVYLVHTRLWYRRNMVVVKRNWLTSTWLSVNVCYRPDLWLLFLDPNLSFLGFKFGAETVSDWNCCRVIVSRRHVTSQERTWTRTTHHDRPPDLLLRHLPTCLPSLKGPPTVNLFQRLSDTKSKVSGSFDILRVHRRKWG